MKFISRLLILLSLTIGAKAQNLIMNGDFELSYSCPVALSMIDTAQFWNNATINGTPDYFHQCANPFFAGVPVNQIGYQQPHSGQAYAGVYLWQLTNNYREFMQGQISEALIAGNCYHFEMFINLSNFLKHTSSNIGVLFSDTMITGVLGLQIQALTPQIVNPPGAYPDTASWMLVSGDFTASGGESFVIIGNFDVDAAIDSVLTNPFGIWPGTHVLVDDVSLTVCTGVNDPSAISAHVYPNPVSDLLTINFTHDTNNMMLRIVDLTGKTIYSKSLTTSLQSIHIDMKEFSGGVYFLELQGDQFSLNKKIAVIK